MLFLLAMVELAQSDKVNAQVLIYTLYAFLPHSIIKE